ncbi:MAG: signal peptidase II [Alphaproteobacteria bacterium]
MRAGLAIAVVVLALDQATKWLIVAVVMAPPRVIEVAGFFNLVMVWNRGMSFGLLGDWGAGDGARWAMAGLALAIVAALLLWLRRVEGVWAVVGIGLVIGGAVGNVIDRAVWGAVADFLDFHVAGLHWPAFNVADTAIVLGVAALLADGLFGPAPEAK